MFLSFLNWDSALDAEDLRWISEIDPCNSRYAKVSAFHFHFDTLSFLHERGICTEKAIGPP